MPRPGRLLSATLRSGRVRPVPFFLFGERDPLTQLLERLSGNEVPLDFDRDLFNPFPAGTRIHVAERAGDTVTIDLQFSAAAPQPEAMAAIVTVIAETASQFDPIRKTILRVDGRAPAGMPETGFIHDPARIVQPDAPVLFMVTGAWDPGAKGPHEIVANFDRPVTITSFRLETPNGEELKGNYFQSAFDMSVVLHPADPAVVREGMSLTASWDVTDALGRRGAGHASLTLLRRSHVEPD